MVALPRNLARYVVEKGSITVDGVSLTVVSVSDGHGRVHGEPDPDHAGAAPRLGTGPSATQVNLEVDVIAKYVERLLGGRE